MDGEFAYAQLPAWDGSMGVAPGRAPMVIKLGNGLLRLEDIEGQSKWFFVGGGFAQMNQNALCLLTPELIPASEADAAAASAKLNEVEGKVAVTDQAVEDRDHTAQKARLLLNLAKRGE